MQQQSDADSAVETKSSSCNSSLGETEYATISRSCEESDATVAADDSLSLYSRPYPKAGKQASETVIAEPHDKPDEKRSSTPQPLGLDSEALAAVEMLARAVSSDSLLADSSPCGGSVSSGSPANSHSSLDKMKLHEDDSGTDVNNPSSSSSSAASSCAGDAVAAVECGEYEDVNPVNLELKVQNTAPLDHLHHHYEAMFVKPETKVVPVAAVYSAVGKPNKLPAPGAQPLPGMYSDDKEGAVKPGGKPQFLLELSKRAAAAEQASKQGKQDNEPYTFMEFSPSDKIAKGVHNNKLNQHPKSSNSPSQCGTYVKKSQQQSQSRSGSSLLSKSASGCVAALSQLSAQKFPPHLTAPIFYNPLVQCPPPPPPVETSPPPHDPLLRPGNKTPCPVFKPHGFEPLPEGGPGGSAGGAASDSEHLTDSFDEDEMTTSSGKPGLVEEPLWRRPAEPSVCSWRSSLDPPLCRRSVAMETIIEEPPSAQGGQGSGRCGQDDSRLTVREILRRFEQLGGKVPSLCDGEHGRGGDEHEEDPEESATLREIQETLMNLEEKVRNYQCKIASSDKSGPPSIVSVSPVQQPPQQQQQQPPQQLLPPQQKQQQQPQQVQHKCHHHHSRQVRERH